MLSCLLMSDYRLVLQANFLWSSTEKRERSFCSSQLTLKGEQRLYALCSLNWPNSELQPPTKIPFLSPPTQPCCRKIPLADQKPRPNMNVAVD